MPSPWSQERYIKAHAFAARAHRGQQVSGTRLPYVTHIHLVTMEVIAALWAEPGRRGDLAVQCALLHDVIEDTSVSYEEISAEFGVAVADGVLALSKDPALDKSRRMADSLTRIRRQPEEVWMVKLADRITNLQSPPPHWTRTKTIAYRQEAQSIHAALQEASPYLSKRLLAKIDAYRVYTEEQADA